MINKLKAEIISLKYSLNDAHKKFYEAKIESVDKDKIILDLVSKLNILESRGQGDPVSGD